MDSRLFGNLPKTQIALNSSMSAKACRQPVTFHRGSHASIETYKLRLSSSIRGTDSD